MVARGRITAFQLHLMPTAEQTQAFLRHAGAARFAYNVELAATKAALAANDARTDGTRMKVPWSGLDHINHFNAWKVSPEVGVDADGRPGLSWRGEVYAQVFEEAGVDLGRALAAYAKSKAEEAKNGGKQRRVGFPGFRKKGKTKPSFRIRNKGGSIRFSATNPCLLLLPKIGEVAVRCRGKTLRRLHRLLRSGRADLAQVTVSETCGVWQVSVLLRADPFHAAMRQPADSRPAEADAPQVMPRPVGVDLGLTTFAVVANADGTELHAIRGPKPLQLALCRLARCNRALARKKRGSHGRAQALLRLQRLHRDVRRKRQAFQHRFSRLLAKTHGHLVLEDLNVAGMMHHPNLARSIADSGWSAFAHQVAYKASWYGSVVSRADRFFPSTQLCSSCGARGQRLTLKERQFHCATCGHSANRDVNAATCLARFPEYEKGTGQPLGSPNDRGG